MIGHSAFACNQNPNDQVFLSMLISLVHGQADSLWTLLVYLVCLNRYFAVQRVCRRRPFDSWFHNAKPLYVIMSCSQLLPQLMR